MRLLLISLTCAVFVSAVSIPAFGEVVVGGELVYALVRNSFETGKYGPSDCQGTYAECRQVLIDNKVKDVDRVSKMCVAACNNGRNKLAFKSAIAEAEAYILKTYGPYKPSNEKPME